MDGELKKAVHKARIGTQAAFPKERASFKALVLKNPNYFGNLAESVFAPVLAIASSTFYEELGCLGYQPQQRHLEAVVYQYQPSGYGTDICGPGTPEYVRFYLSYDNGATWVDQGITSFQAYNIPEGTDASKRLEHAVSLPVNPIRKFCFFDPLIRARAILSWNNPPPPNQPNWVPIFGNVREETILVEPFRIIFWRDLFELEKIKLPPQLKDVIDFEAPIPTKTKSLGAVELASLYRNKGVPSHRFAFKELSSFISSKSTLSAEAFTKFLPGIELDPNIGSILFPPTDGDTSFEELKCIGLDPNSPDTLVGVIQVKKSSGYSGGPCTDGSKEYVTFWGDFDGDGTLETCLGTASVTAYDVSVPAAGVFYAVRLPVDLNSYRQTCTEGPRVVRIRAILSWQAIPPCANPNHVPVWGNREETLINIAPSASAPAGKIAILGGIPVVHIDDSTGVTTPTAVFATNNLPPDSLGRPCPFGARLTVQGAPLVGFEYLVEVTPVDIFNNPVGAPTPVVTNLTLTRLDGTTFTLSANFITHRFAYQNFDQNVNSVLAQWDSGGDERWQVKLTTYTGGGVLVGTDTHLVQLDNTAPEASIDITSGLGNCGKFTIGDNISGVFVARDDNLGSYSLGVEPAINPAGIGEPVPGSGIVNTAPAPGDAWTLDTANMASCGYVVRIVVVDRAIVNSQSVGHVSSDSAGFCLEHPE